MPFNPDQHQRQSSRLKEYDYSKVSAYFVTLCSRQRECLFGEIEETNLRLSAAGIVAGDLWLTFPSRFRNIRLDAFRVMPNHVHGIVIIQRQAGGTANKDGGEADKARVTANQDGGLMNQTPTADGDLTWILMKNRKTTLGKIIRYYKALTSRKIGGPIWQRNYHDRVIRNRRELERIRQYIKDNPLHWQSDEYHPANIKHRKTKTGKRRE